MVQVIEQTQEDKMKMYMKLSKKELASMLVQANNHLAILTAPNPIPFVNPIAEWPITYPQNPPLKIWPPFYTTCEQSSAHTYIY